MRMSHNVHYVGKPYLTTIRTLAIQESNQIPSASFHPITNRKHHCRLCGKIICSLPVKYPQRPQPCSLLFVADPFTGAIEEVKEGVDYGVRRRTTSVSQGKGKGKEPAHEQDEDRSRSLGSSSSRHGTHEPEVCVDCLVDCISF